MIPPNPLHHPTDLLAVDDQPTQSITIEVRAVRKLGLLRMAETARAVADVLEALAKEFGGAADGNINPRAWSVVRRGRGTLSEEVRYISADWEVSQNWASADGAYASFVAVRAPEATTLPAEPGTSLPATGES